MYIITLDTGTTNSRVVLWKGTIVIDKKTFEVGVRNTAIEGNNELLKSVINQGIKEVIYNNDLKLDQIKLILASGMITSNVGLHEVPHIKAPAGIKELSNNIKKVLIKDVVNKPIHFIPGIKNNVTEITLENCLKMDIMRGEETEVIGLIENLNIKGPSLIILPGSHSKFVFLDKTNKVLGCLTSLMGELVSVISNNTIISDSVNHSFANSFEETSFIEGYKSSKLIGLNRTIFNVRILDQFTELSYNQKANYLLGSLIADDIKLILNNEIFETNKEVEVFIAGKKILSQAFDKALKFEKCFDEIKVIDNNIINNLAGLGVISIAKESGLIN